ncbi:probable receptor-like serine/threonine-protein kinase At5g57670 isoform X1 [Dioscorea cayenensis subsp. rotundata]|uniref:Probable receptor-like serine/threonine-protein kinase At5g57670 isoform X1 n=1 Tax=Dioscorea cayennensis subsp. rotundata TaxID=55577 RepID=A0AB40CT03_DIOCR|nr:probable receptor-like serine/threonine-protein kinase At5g57670 isoform X1 [Dioscorea cayenensis subsp. rotundata]
MKQLNLRRKSLRRLFSFSSSQRSSVDEVDTEKSVCIYQESDAKPLQKPNWRCFTYAEIHIATNGFHQGNLVGSGGHAEVYRGVLADGRVIAVKRLTRGTSDERREKEFLTELGTVSHVQHPNVSELVGCCIDLDLHLIFEFSSHGSVSSHLHEENSLPLTWNLRYGIAVGTAQGLHYLHKGCQRRIIHRDIKASNILLTANYEPQISDFGLAKWLPSEWTYCAVKPIEGTVGYLAPEYFMHGIVDEKTDVFAFGVFLLEIISGRKPVDGSHRSLLSWAKTYLDDEMVHLLVDPRLGDEFNIGQLRQLAFVASLCVRATASWRPSMTEVLQLLTDGETPQNGWKMPEGEEEDLWDFEDLDECDKTTSSSLSTS